MGILAGICHRPSLSFGCLERFWAVCSSFYPSVLSAVYPSKHLPSHSPAHQSSQSVIHLSILLSISPSFCPSLHPSVYLSICPVLHPPPTPQWQGEGQEEPEPGPKIEIVEKAPSPTSGAGSKAFAECCTRPAPDPNWPLPEALAKCEVNRALLLWPSSEQTWKPAPEGAPQLSSLPSVDHRTHPGVALPRSPGLGRNLHR